MVETEQTATLKSQARMELSKHLEYRRSIDALMRLSEFELERVERMSRMFDSVSVQKQPNPKAGEDMLIEAIDRKHNLQIEAQEYENKCIEIENKIMQLDEKNHVVMLLRVYVFRQSVENAAREMHYSKRHAWRLYNDALLAYGEKMACFGTK